MAATEITSGKVCFPLVFLPGDTDQKSQDSSEQGKWKALNYGTTSWLISWFRSSSRESASRKGKNKDTALSLFSSPFPNEKTGKHKSQDLHYRSKTRTSPALHNEDATQTAALVTLVKSGGPHSELHMHSTLIPQHRRARNCRPNLTSCLCKAI